ncbi:unnamed protein product, partial [Coregonus sp. 'balchen']
MPGPHRSRRERLGLPTRSPHLEVGDLNCLLINEEGYLQDSSVLYPEHGVPEAGNRADHRGITSIHSGSSAHNDDFGHSLNLRDRSQEQLTGRVGGGGRRHACNQQFAMMSEATVTFQSQLSGVMETVFKTAMYEITRLVEDSFLKEVSRSREQVESLKKRLQWSENRRRERDRDGGRTGKCGDCGKAAEERNSGTSQT